MSVFASLFQAGVNRPDAMTGFYNPGLVALAYAIAVLSAYVTMDLVGRLRQEVFLKAGIFWLLGAAFVLGSGIWSVNFIALSSLILPKEILYALFWTLGSFFVVFILACLILTLFFYVRSFWGVRLSAWLIGSLVIFMFFMGIQSIKVSLEAHYALVFFGLACLFVFVCVEMAFRIGLLKNNELNLSALFLGSGICGMQYFGFSAMVFTPTPHDSMTYFDTVSPENMMIVIGGFTVLMISLAVTASAYYKSVVSIVSSEKNFLNAMLDNLADGIIACDAKGNITVLNDVLKRYIDAPVKSIDDLRKLFRLLHPDTSPITSEAFPLNRALSGERIIKDEFIVVFHNGRTRDLFISGQPIVDHEQKKVGAVIVAHDVTELKKTERLKNEFVSIVSHELRTPLTSIRGSLGILTSGVLGVFPEKVKKLLDIANNNCDRLLLLINDILDIEKIEAGKMDFHLQRVELGKILSDAIDANRMYAEKFGLTLNLHLLDQKLYVKVDPDRLMQVLANLISNACKFSPKGEAVKVSVRLLMNEQVEVSIKDKGQGIPPEFQSRIFQKFSQADSSDTRGKSGTGLGLNISKTMIEKFNGTIGFMTKANQGTTFYFRLPLQNDHVAQAPSKKMNESRSLTNKRFLLCEDHPETAQKLLEVLESAGYVTDLAESIDIAMKNIKKHKYCAILLDFNSKEIDSMAFIRKLQDTEETKDLPAIVLSVLARTGHGQLGRSPETVQSWLGKQVNVDKFVASIENL